MGSIMTVAYDPSAPSGHLPALRAGRKAYERRLWSSRHEQVPLDPINLLN